MVSNGVGGASLRHMPNESHNPSRREVDHPDQTCPKQNRQARCDHVVGYYFPERHLPHIMIAKIDKRRCDQLEKMAALPALRATDPGDSGTGCAGGRF